jgi:hypothetical protein
VSVLISGVTSKWFTVESIGGIENAAVSFVPEEYLRPLDRRASVRMIQKMGRVAGLGFPADSASVLAEATCDMPFWIRQACSFIHGQYDIESRPVEIPTVVLEDHLERFIETDGATLATLALQHLFRVYEDLREDFLRIADGRPNDCSLGHLRALNKYGIINSRNRSQPALSGRMIVAGLELVRESPSAATSAGPTREPTPIAEGNYLLGEWADELALINKRRNLLERKFRTLIINLLRFDTLSEKSKPSPIMRLLAAIPENRRDALQGLSAEEIADRLFWLDLVQVVKREWTLFGKIFNDKPLFEQHSQIVNERPDAHAKSIDAADVALQRRALTWLEDKVAV